MSMTSVRQLSTHSSIFTLLQSTAWWMAPGFITGMWSLLLTSWANHHSLMLMPELTFLTLSKPPTLSWYTQLPLPEPPELLSLALLWTQLITLYLFHPQNHQSILNPILGSLHFFSPITFNYLAFLCPVHLPQKIPTSVLIQIHTTGHDTRLKILSFSQYG